LTRHHPVVDLDDPVHDADSVDSFQDRQVPVLAHGEHQSIGFNRVELAGGMELAVRVEFHPLEDELAFVEALNRAEPSDLNSFLRRFLDLEGVCRHSVCRSTIDDARLLGSQTLDRPRRVERRVAAAVDRHSPADARRFSRLDVPQEIDCIEDSGGVAGRDFDAMPEVCADWQRSKPRTPPSSFLRARRSPATRTRAVHPDRECARSRSLELRVEVDIGECHSASCRRREEATLGS
jgi:hypothetical protein